MADILSLQGISWCAPSLERGQEERILSNLDLTLIKGEWLAIGGASGSGKSTLLAICAGILMPEQGLVRLAGNRLSALSQPQMAQLRSKLIGIVFQNFQLDDSMSAMENILLPGYFSQVPWHHLKARARMLASKLGIEPQLKKTASVLSGGQKQRVAIARAFILEPELILADEPTGALDTETARIVVDLFKEHHAKGLSIMTFTHDLSLAGLADRYLILSDGCLQAKSLKGCVEA